MVDTLHTFDFEAVWEDLVDQFADPLSCLRELVQNAIDAESGEVEIEVDYEPADIDAGGRIILHVRDWGVGMDREIIEGRLTELFHSGKDEDYTKIGRFGIGFVSVFALEPSVVCVDTGRSGEYWRVLLHGDGRYELIALDRPVEGTHVRIVVPASRERFERLRGRVGGVLSYWCKHASIPVRFDGGDVREPFEVESPCAVSYREEGTRIVAGLVESAEAPYGYYNRGLTLEEGEAGPTPHVAFKIDSRYLEHTLTRDQVVENEDYHKARDRLDALIADDLPTALLDELQAAASGESARSHDRLAHLLACFFEAYPERPSGWRRRPIIPTVSGDFLSLQQCAAAARDGRLSVYAGGDTLERRLVGENEVVVRADGTGRGVASLLRQVTGRSIPELRSRYAIPSIYTTLERPGADSLVREFTRLGEVVGVEFESVAFGDFYDESPVVETLVVAAEAIHEPRPVDEIPEPSRANLARYDRCLINLDHELVGELLTVAEDEPEFAALSLVKMICGSELTSEEEAELAALVVERRRRRRGGDE